MPPTPKRIAYLFTTFPKLSERFLERELEGLAAHTDLEIEIHSLLGGGGNTFERFPVSRFRLHDWLALPYRLLRELIRHPRAFHEIARLNDAYLPKSWINGLEHYLGLAFAIVRAAEFRKDSPHRIHAVWATGPASAAWFLNRLNGTPFSMGCHAYDLFRNGGDVLLTEKIKAARFIHTSTAQARAALIAKGAPAGKVCLIRRSAPQGKPPLPTESAARSLSEKPEPPASANNRPNQSAPIRILSVGRLVEKKGYFELLTILRKCADASIPFSAKIIGEGPLRNDLERRIAQLRLNGRVELVGQMPNHEVEATYRSFADVFFFTGKTAASGDRDGLPNVIIEAIHAGVPVFASGSGATAEALQTGHTGELIDINRPEMWAAALRRLAQDAEYAARLRHEARSWVERHCNPRTNALALAERLVS